MDNMKFQAALPKPESSGMSFTLLFTTFLDLMKLAIHNKEVYMFLKLISKNSIVPKNRDQVDLTIPYVRFRRTVDVVS